MLFWALLPRSAVRGTEEAKRTLRTSYRPALLGECVLPSCSEREFGSKRVAADSQTQTSAFPYLHSPHQSLPLPPVANEGMSAINANRS
jgi:hypothetical protein